MKGHERESILSKSEKLGESIANSVVIQSWVLEQIDDWNEDVVKATFSSMISQYIKRKGFDETKFLRTFAEIMATSNHIDFVGWLETTLKEYKK